MNIRVWFLLLGMSVHSFFEGVALGVQNDSNAFWQILIAVLFHEVLCCVSYGVQLAKHNASRKYAWTSSIFLSATIPAGMILATTVYFLSTRYFLNFKFEKFRLTESKTTCGKELEDIGLKD